MINLLWFLRCVSLLVSQVKCAVGFFPPRTKTPITFALPAGVRFLTLGIAAKIAMIGLMESGYVLVSI